MTTNNRINSINNSRVQRKFPHKLALYLLKEFLLPFVCTILAFSALFFLRDVVEEGSEIFGGTTLGQALTYFSVKFLENFSNIVPMSILLSTSFMMVQLGKNGELTAIRSAGISLMKCGAYVWGFAALCAVIVFFIGEVTTQFYADVMNNPKELRDKEANGSHADSRKQIEYANIQEGRDWYFADLSLAPEGVSHGVKIAIYDNCRYEYDGKSYVSRGVTENALTEKRRVSKILIAKEAIYRENEWLLKNVKELSMTYEVAVKESEEQPLPQIEEKAIPEMLLKNFIETPKKIIGHSKSIESMSIGKLMRISRDGKDLGERALKEARVRMWSRLTFPLASLVGAFFGVALSIAVGRAGVLKGFASSVGILVLFSVSSKFLEVWAISGNLPAFLGGALSNIVFLFAGLVVLYRRR